jgi:hypothetical protein
MSLYVRSGSDMSHDDKVKSFACKNSISVASS